MVLQKGPVSGGKREVLFLLPPEVDAGSAVLCGEFNDWSEHSLPMERNSEGAFVVSVMLESGKRYRYRYLLDGTRWENDWRADDYEANEFGGEDSVVDA